MTVKGRRGLSQPPINRETGYSNVLVKGRLVSALGGEVVGLPWEVSSSLFHTPFRIGISITLEYISYSISITLEYILLNFHYILL